MDGFTYNILGVNDLIENQVNKISSKGTTNVEGKSGEKVDILELSTSDEDLLKLRDDWEKEYATYEARILPIFRRNLRSYLGRDKHGALLEDGTPGAANLQFEAEETFLPAALARNPDPLVYCDNTPEGNKIAQDVKTMLQFHADQLLLKRKLEVMIRQWSIYHLGVVKYGWNPEISDISLENRKIKDFIFDPNGFVDVFGDFSSYLGERIEVTAERLIDLFPKHKKYISDEVENKLGTKVIYTEWWTDKYCFVTFKDKVLDKHKNEFFRYSEDLGELDDSGQPFKTEPRNHFAAPKKPYTFLSIFSLEEQPHDITGLIEQNIPNQSKISKRVEQIDINVSKSNNSELYSENNFTQETAKQAAMAIKDPAKGQVLIPPGGPISEAIVRLPSPSFPDAAFKDLENSENHLRSSWGIQGISSQPQTSDTTARGMILNQGRDVSRIGGGISDVVEQSVARSVFNWFVQLYAVFYDEKHFASVMGMGKAVEYATLSNMDLDRQLVISVSPNSMKPRDEVTTMNQAVDLYSRGAIGPKTLLETLNFPDPDESAADGVLWAIDKIAYLKLNFPDLMAQLEQMQAQAQAQMATQAGAVPTSSAPAPNVTPTREPTAIPFANLPIPSSPTGL